jgi:hypothetical protein
MCFMSVSASVRLSVFVSVCMCEIVFICVSLSVLFGYLAIWLCSVTSHITRARSLRYETTRQAEARVHDTAASSDAGWTLDAVPPAHRSTLAELANLYPITGVHGFSHGRLLQVA